MQAQIQENSGLAKASAHEMVPDISQYALPLCVEAEPQIEPDPFRRHPSGFDQGKSNRRLLAKSFPPIVERRVVQALLLTELLLRQPAAFLGRNSLAPILVPGASDPFAQLVLAILQLCSPAFRLYPFSD
jgi:hypothetical protein